MQTEDTLSRERKVVDFVVSKIDLLSQFHDADPGAWEELYSYAFQKAGVPDTPEIRRAFELGFGIAALSERDQKRETLTDDYLIAQVKEALPSVTEHVQSTHPHIVTKVLRAAADMEDTAPARRAYLTGFTTAVMATKAREKARRDGILGG